MIFYVYPYHCVSHIPTILHLLLLPLCLLWGVMMSLKDFESEPEWSPKLVSSASWRAQKTMINIDK